jgi:hypothetical protein
MMKGGLEIQECSNTYDRRNCYHSQISTQEHPRAAEQRPDAIADTPNTWHRGQTSAHTVQQSPTAVCTQQLDTKEARRPYSHHPLLIPFGESFIVRQRRSESSDVEDKSAPRPWTAWGRTIEGAERNIFSQTSSVVDFDPTDMTWCGPFALAG